MQQEPTREDYERLPERLECWSTIAFSYMPFSPGLICKVCQKKGLVIIKHLGYLHLLTDPRMCVSPQYCDMSPNFAVTVFCEACGIEALNSIEHYTYEYKRIQWGQETIKVVKKLPPWRRAKRANFQ